MRSAELFLHSAFILLPSQAGGSPRIRTVFSRVKSGDLTTKACNAKKTGREGGVEPPQSKRFLFVVAKKVSVLSIDKSRSEHGIIRDQTTLGPRCCAGN